jgi:hypothetical protein
MNLAMRGDTARSLSTPSKITMATNQLPAVSILNLIPLIWQPVARNRRNPPVIYAITTTPPADERSRGKGRKKPGAAEVSEHRHPSILMPDTPSTFVSPSRHLPLSPRMRQNPLHYGRPITKTQWEMQGRNGTRAYPSITSPLRIEQPPYFHPTTSIRRHTSAPRPIPSPAATPVTSASVETPFHDGIRTGPHPVRKIARSDPGEAGGSPQN